MPYEIIRHGKCYSVVNTETNKLHSRCSTLKNAKKQERLLRAIENGFVPKKRGIGLKRTVGVYPPSVRRLLKSNGNDPITSVKVVRTPINKAVKAILNVVSLGAYEKAVKESGYEKMLHLALFINDTFQLDKQSVVVLKKGNPISKDSEVMDVKSIPSDITLQSLLDKTKSSMGDDKFSNYDAHTNNCQDFVIAVLQSNDMLNDDLKSFIKQDADAVFKNIPKFSEKIAKVITDVGAVADKLVEGENLKNIPNNKMAGTESTEKCGTGTKTRKPNKWLIHVKKVRAMKKHKGKSLKEILRIAKESYKK